ncbi:hypothetical protein V6N12_063507 [Hibiscus sabdariffa]|uniref:Uncharacterized protein n=1 Tax=Hibiscus sabdariffa TaxID=183260 RepID=A0ABR2FBY5_9ROSI
MLQQQVQTTFDAHHSVTQAVFPVIVGANKLCQAAQQCTRNEQYELVTSEGNSSQSFEVAPQVEEDIPQAVEPSLTVAEANSQVEELVNTQPDQVDESGGEARELLPEPEVTREVNEATSLGGDTGEIQDQCEGSLLADGALMEGVAEEQSQQMIGVDAMMIGVLFLGMECMWVITL